MQPNRRADEPSRHAAFVKVRLHNKKKLLPAQLHPLTLLIANGGHGGEMDEEESERVFVSER